MVWVNRFLLSFILFILSAIVMSEYQHKQIAFWFKGICLTSEPDLIADGKFSVAKNIRSYKDGVIQARLGQIAAYNDTLAQANIHSIKRLNNDLSTASQAYSIIAGSGTQLFSDNSAHTTINNSRASGFSGDPLSIIPFRPNASPEPYAYIADRLKMGKLKVDGTFRNIGIAPPTTYPKGPSGAAMPAINTLQSTTIDAGISTAGSWVSGTGMATVVNTAGPTDTISGIIYDVGTIGWACVAIASPGDRNFYQVGAMATANTSTEIFTLDSVYLPVRTTTIASIIYDAGSTGLCTIVPSSFKRKSLVPDAIMLLNTGGGSAEYVRILSVSYGDDDLPSVRCSTVNNHTAGESITGQLSFRAIFVNNHTAGQTFNWDYMSFIPSDLANNTTVVAYATRTVSLDLGNIGGRPVQDDDEMNFLIYLFDSYATASNPSILKEVQIQLDIDDGSFTKNFYYIPIKISDLTPIIAGQQTVEEATSNKITGDIIGNNDLSSDDSGAQLRAKLQRRLAKAQRNGNTARVARLQRRIDEIDERNPIVHDDNGSIPALGLNAFIPVKVKIKDLKRIGADLTRNLANVSALRVRITCSNAKGSVALSGNFFILFNYWQIAGSYGPDAGEIGTPYIYRFRYIASESGTRSYPSPATRSGVIPHRQRVQLSAPASSDVQVDKIEWFRFGGSLNVWKRLGIGPNSTATFNDDFPDDTILNAPQLTFDEFQPFPIVSTPITGTVTVSGTMVTVTSGAVSTSMAPGIEIIINSIPCTLYAPPISTTRFEIVENIGSLVGASLYIPEPLLIGQSLPVMFGPFGQGFLDQVMFACGDSNNPGNIYWTNPSDPDSASDRNTLEVCSPSEPLMNGFLYNNTAYVFSSEDLYVLYPSPDSDGRLTFRANKTGLGLGLAGRYAVCVGEGKIWFVSRDGIYVTESSNPVSITDVDLYPLFPHDGLAGQSINGYIPPDFTSPNTLRLSIGDSFLFFDYKGTDTSFYTLIYDINKQSWMFDSYGRQVTTRYFEEGKNTHRWLLGASNGKLYQYGGTSDDGIAINGIITPRWENFGDSRIQKVIAEDYLDFDPDGASITVQPGLDNNSILPTPTVLTSTAGRRQQVIDLPKTAGGLDVLSRNITHTLSWSSITSTPKLYLFDYYFLLKVDNTFRRFTDYMDLGYSGPKLIRGFRLRADTENVLRSIKIEYDNVSSGVIVPVQHNGELIKSYDVPVPFYAYLVRVAPQDALMWRQYDIDFIFDKYPDLDNIITEWTDGGSLGDKWLQGIILRADTSNQTVNVIVKSDDGNTIDTLTCLHNGDQVKPYSWNPYITHQMRLLPQGNIRIIDAKWIFSPEPELTNFYISQPTGHGLKGFQHIPDGYVAVRSAVDLHYTITIDGVDYVYNIANTGGVYRRIYVPFQAVKGKVFQYSLTPMTGTTGFRVYEKDFSIRVKEWGSDGEYLTLNPLGLPNNAPVALI